MEKKKITRVILSAIFIALLSFSIFYFIKIYFGGRKNPAFLEVSGRIEGREYHAATKIAGRVEEMFVEEGQQVKKGDPIGKIDSKQTQAMLEVQEARLKQAESSLALAEFEYRRYERLFKQRAAAKMEYEQYKTKFDLAGEEVVSAKREVDKLNADIEDLVIPAPVTGTVVTKIVRNGEVVAAGTPLVTIIDMDDLYLKIFLSTDFAGKVRLGNEAKIYPDALVKDEFDAVVDKIAEKAEFTPKNVETKSQRAKLVFEIKLKIKDNKGYALKPGMPSNGVIKIVKDASWGSWKKR